MMRSRRFHPQSAATFARRLGLSLQHVEWLCRVGRIEGARVHPLTR